MLENSELALRIPFPEDDFLAGTFLLINTPLEITELLTPKTLLDVWFTNIFFHSLITDQN